MSTFVTARNTISYREVVSATDPIETPSIGFAKPSDFQGVTPGIATIIKKNNTKIHLLTQIAETLREIQQELRKQNTPHTPLPQDLISKLQNLSLGPSKPKEKPGKLRGVVDYLTSHGVNALPGQRLSTRSLQGLNWVINPTQISIPMQPTEVNSQTMMDGRISLSFNNYTAAPTPKQPKYNDKDKEILVVLIETKLGVYVYYDGEADDYYEEQKSKYKIGRWDTLGQPSGKFDYYVNYDIPEIPSFPEIPPTGWDDEDGETNNSQKEESIAASERSGLAWKTGIDVGAGVIDSDYRGEVQDPGVCSKAVKSTHGGGSIYMIDLKRREKELQAREAELDKREVGIIIEKKNWPSFFPYHTP
ncbi:hypothetical protein ZIOFF_017884 [Zingiber officinale]|uniref:Uncharacterized protein n=1 Tax=Zingiber officinale TaxID=94328 RepID=A0A8J5HFQ4_ZINOF|nr:hypothetical protein ZIOFF_017884 [Zingiber officinale]